MSVFTPFVTTRLTILALTVLLVPGGIARADLSALPIPAWPGLPQDDVNRMTAAAARLYEGRSIGTVERWRSPDSKNAGEVKLTRSFATHGMPCRTVEYTIRFNEQRNQLDHYVLTWCKVGDEGWKIVEVPTPR
jgi:hypothetical protein